MSSGESGQIAEDYADKAKFYLNNKGEKIALVNDSPIYRADLEISRINNDALYNSALTQYENMKGVLSETELQRYYEKIQAMKKDTDELLRGLIRGEIIKLEAQKRGILPTDEEVREYADDSWGTILSLRNSEDSSERQMAEEQYDSVRIIWESWGITEKEYFEQYLLPIYEYQLIKNNLYKELSDEQNWSSDNPEKFNEYIDHLAESEYTVERYEMADD